jgi:hypothetical protein
MNTCSYSTDLLLYRENRNYASLDHKIQPSQAAVVTERGSSCRAETGPVRLLTNFTVLREAVRRVFNVTLGSPSAALRDEILEFRGWDGVRSRSFSCRPAVELRGLCSGFTVCAVVFALRRHSRDGERGWVCCRGTLLPQAFVRRMWRMLQSRWA